jgi:hypothetical protein
MAAGEHTVLRGSACAGPAIQHPAGGGILLAVWEADEVTVAEFEPPGGARVLHL